MLLVSLVKTVWAGSYLEHYLMPFQPNTVPEVPLLRAVGRFHKPYASRGYW